VNIASLMSQTAAQQPEKVATSAPISSWWPGVKTQYVDLSFKQLEEFSNLYAAQLAAQGASPGDRALLFIPPSIEFPIITFALFKLGVVPVMIDPGMGVMQLLRVINEAKPTIMVGNFKAHLLRMIFPKPFGKLKIKLATTIIKLPGTITTRGWTNSKDKTNPHFTPYESNDDESAAILYTSGGTGAPKGVLYTHQIFIQQTKMLQQLFSLGPDDVDLPGFPLFSLFTITMGMRSIVPQMNPSKPAQANPKKLVQAIQDQKVTFAAGSPAIWQRVATYCQKKKITLPSLKYLVMFGAPVAIKLHRSFEGVLTGGTTYTPYGATEALPISTISGTTILTETAPQTEQGEGVCVGDVAPGVKVKIIKITQEELASWEQVEELTVGEIGEIVVSGINVTSGYLNNLPADRLSKISEAGQSENRVWHRMGDLGRLDKQGRIWFYGRKVHRVEASSGDIFYSISCESIINQHPKINRSALVAVMNQGKVVPGLVVESHGLKINPELISQLRQLLANSPITKQINHLYLYPRFPVDVRHNIKIDRIKLAYLVASKKVIQL
jgi:olefin beta-lactone synthetase